MISGPGVHVMPSAGDPQTEHGDCTNLGTRRRRWDWRQLRPVREGYCEGCKSWQPITRRMFRWELDDHDPAPPKHAKCLCGRPYWTGPSYTQPPCDECADQTDQDSFERGDSVPDEGWGIEG